MGTLVSKGNRYGADLSYDVIHLLRESLEGASEIETRLDTPEDFVRAIGTAKEELNPSGEIIILQTGTGSTSIPRSIANFHKVTSPGGNRKRVKE